MVGKKNKFAEVACAACKGKSIAGTFGPPPKWARQAEEIIMLPPPSSPPAIEKPALTQLESSLKGISAAVLVQAEASEEEARAGVTWPRGVQHLAMELARTTSLLEEP